MNSKFSKFLFLFILSMAVFAAAIYAEGDKKNANNLDKVQGAPSRTKMNINNLSTIIYNDGISDIDPSGNSGLIYPKGSNKGAVFTSGLLWGAKVPGDPQPRVGGTAYRTGLQPGRILNSGVPASQLTAEDAATTDHVRIYRVRRDVFPGGQTVDLSSDATDEASSQSAIRAQYEKDWTEWPAQFGAPFEDKNGNGTYEPSADIPGVPGADQTIWFVANDISAAKTTFLYGAQPLGIEMQATMWAYSQTGALGNMYFRKYKLINKSNTPFDSMYVSMWSDVDLGNSTDDFAGCDTTLSLAYCYNANANDPTYSPLPPPAVGFDFFQGPILDGIAGEDRNKNGVDDAEDFGIFDGKVAGPGKINLPMTAFYYFARGDNSVVDPTQGDIAGSTQFYRFFQGKIGLTGASFTDPNTNQPTPFALTGDPQTRQGWIDGQLIPASDRRLGSASGPFTMNPGDIQEVVVAEIVAGAIPGMDRLSAIGLLKFYDEQAQSAYNNFFDLAVAPPSPDVNVVALDKQIVLDWGTNVSRVQQTESFDGKGYVFQGYNVYQLPTASADKSQGKRIAVYDIVDGVSKIEDREFDPSTGVVAVRVQQFGNDTGIKRFVSIKNDEINGGIPLVNGKRYYFAVTAYGYNPEAVPNNLENPISIITIVPQSNNPGVRLGASHADTLVAVNSGKSDGNVFPVVIDPSKLTGHNYKVVFETATVGSEIHTTWTLRDETAGQVLFTQMENQSGDEEYPFVHGFQIKVQGPPPGMKDWDIPNGTRRFTFADGYANFEGFENTIGWDDPAHFFGSTGAQAVSAADLKNVLLKLAPASSGTETNPDAGNNPYGGWDVNDPSLHENYSYGYRFLRGATAAPARLEFVPYIVNPSAGYAYQDYKKGVPLSAWNMEVDPPQRLAVGHLENNVATGLVDGKWWPGSNGTGTAGNSGSTREWLFVFNMPYTDANPVTELQKDILNNGLPVMFWLGVQRRGGANFENGDEFLILANHINTPSDVFTFSAPAATSNNDLAVEDVAKINVFPNPYYGLNSEELNKYNRFVTFNHLPQKATVKIFNLAGVLVQTIEKNDNSQFMRWNLANQSGLPVASGLYIAHIEMPDLGTTKILKVAIIQEQQILDRF